MTRIRSYSFLRSTIPAKTLVKNIGNRMMPLTQSRCQNRLQFDSCSLKSSILDRKNRLKSIKGIPLWWVARWCQKIPRCYVGTLWKASSARNARGGKEGGLMPEALLPKFYFPLKEKPNYFAPPLRLRASAVKIRVVSNEVFLLPKSM